MGVKLGDEEEITDVLTPKGVRELKKGQVLMFDKVHMQITRKRGKRVWAKRTILYTEREFGKVMAIRNQEIADKQEKQKKSDM